MSRRSARWHLWGVCIVIGLVWVPARALSQVEQLPHWSGQGVAPVYEGFDHNPDGSFNMWFGYMNRNYEEELDIPVGPANSFEPSVDSGQPTHFSTRRHKDVFRVVVPPDFGNKQLVWTLSAHGSSEKVIGTINPVWEIDRRRTTRGGNANNVDSNTPPVVKVEPVEQTITLPQSATVRVSATDDGLPKRRGKTIGLTVEWFKYRGPGQVGFEPARHPLQEVVSGAATAVTFTEPGVYILQTVVDDGSGETAGNFGYHCCWTNAQVQVTVKAPSNGTTQRGN